MKNKRVGQSGNPRTTRTACPSIHTVICTMTYACHAISCHSRRCTSLAVSDRGKPSLAPWSTYNIGTCSVHVLLSYTTIGILIAYVTLTYPLRYQPFTMPNDVSNTRSSATPCVVFCRDLDSALTLSQNAPSETTDGGARPAW